MSAKKKQRGLLGAVLSVSGMTLLSRVLGFLRDLTFANAFGAAGVLDVFIVAFKLPNFFRRLFGEGAFSQAFVPALSAYQRESADSLKPFVAGMMGTLLCVVAALVLLVEWAAPGVVMIVAPGFLKDPPHFALAVSMTRILFPYLLLITVVAFASAVLNAHHRFALPAAVPIVLNTVLIGFVFFLSPYVHYPMIGLAWSVLCAGLLQAVVLLYALSRLGLLAFPRIAYRHPGVRRVFRGMLPALFGVSVAQVSLIIDNGFASFLAKGSISWLYYADRLIYLPLGVIGVAVATVILPVLSRLSAQETKEISLTVDWGLRVVLLLGLPAALACALLAKPMVATLFQHGQFSAADVAMTARALAAYAVGLPAFMLIKVLASAFYAQQNMTRPVRIAFIALLVNVVLNSVLIFSLAHAGLALSTALSAWLNALLLAVYLKKEQGYRSLYHWRRFLGQLVSALAVLGLVLWFGAGDPAYWLSGASIHRALHLLALVAGGVLVYFGVLWSVGMRLSTLGKAHASD